MVSHTCKATYYCWWKLFLLSRLGYCNVYFCKLPQYETIKLQKVLKSGTRFICNIGKRASIGPYMKYCHIIPVNSRVKYNFFLLVFKILKGLAPDYMKDMISLCNVDSRLRSSMDKLRFATSYSNNSIDCELFLAWNSLTSSLRSVQNLDLFKSRLKTQYFLLSFD